MRRSPGTPAPDSGRFHDLLRVHVRARPAAVAAVDAEGPITWRELDARSSRWARRLTALGARPEGTVGVCLDRGIDLIVALLAVLRAGAVYVPLDPALPLRRLEQLATDAEIGLVLSHAATSGRFPREVRMDLPPGRGAAISEPTPDNAAYLIFTSGSSGAPKGVVVEHRSLVALAIALRDTFAVTPESRVLAYSSIGFDASLSDIAMWLAAGCTLHLAPTASLVPGPGLVRLLAERRITHLALTPTALAQLPDASLPDLAVLLVGGEPLPPDLVRRFGPGRRMFNVYGPTETTVTATFHEVVQGEDPPPIGRPLGATIARVMDQEGREVTRGEEGLLAIGGPGVARGYFRRPDLDAEPFTLERDGTRLYRTGDRVRVRSDGALVFLGRQDDQLKIRGVRVEPGEVEAALRELPDVAAAAVAARGTPARLVAYVVLGLGARATPSRWRGPLADRLPAAMVPSAFVVLPALPLLPSGKLDRAALPDPSGERPDLPTPFVGPGNERERRIADAFGRVLGIHPIGVDDDFYALGGDSLAANAVMVELGASLGAASLYAAPTVRQLAGALSQASPAPRRVPRDAPQPASSAQQRVWFEQMRAPGSTAYVLTVAIRLTGPLDSRRLAAALDGVVARHEALRTVFPTVDGVPVQVVGGAVDLALETGANSGHPIPFNLAAGPLWRARLLHRGPEDHVLSFEMHHIVADGASLAVLVRALAALYDGDEPGEPVLQPVDHAAEERSAGAGGAWNPTIAWWAAELQGAPLRTFPGAGGGACAGDRTIVIPEALAADLRERGRATGTSPFVLLLAALGGALLARGGGPDLVIGTPVRAPERDAIGFYANTVAIRLRLPVDPSVTDLVVEARRAARGALSRGEVPFDRVVAALPERRGTTPLFEVLFALQDAPPVATTRAGLTMRVEPGPPGAPPFPLTIELWPRDGGWTGHVTFAADRVPPEVVEGVVADLLALLERAVADPDMRLSSVFAHAQRPASWATADLLADPDVDDAVVEDATGSRTAWVVLRPDIDPVGWLPRVPPPGRLLDAVIPVTAIPLRDGGVDEDAIRLLGSDEQPPDLHGDRPLAVADGGPLVLPTDFPTTLPEALLRTVARSGSRLLHFVEGPGLTVTLTYADLLAEAQAGASGLLAAGVNPGDPVVLVLEALHDVYTAFWACLFAGAVPVIVGLPVSDDPAHPAARRLADVVTRLGARVWARDDRVGAFVPSGSILPFPGPAHPVAAHGPQTGGTVAFYQLSSGSTGRVRIIPETHAAALRHVASVTGFCGYDQHDITLTWLPPDHVATLLMCHVKDVVLGCTQVHVRTALVAAEPLCLFHLVQSHTVTHTLLPDFGLRLLVDALATAPTRSWDLSSLRRIANGSEQVTVQATRAFLTATARFGLDPGAMQPGFGMAETASVVTFDNSFSLATGVRQVRRVGRVGALRMGEAPTSTPFVSLGGPLPGVEIRIVDGEGAVVREGWEGALQVRGGVVMPGYLDEPEGTEAVFADGGWLDTGDLGFLWEGRLSITGRAKETLVVRGAKLACHEVEAVVAGVAGVEVAAACAVRDGSGTEGFVVFVVAGGEEEGVSRAIRGRVTEAFGAAPLRIVAVAADTLPRTPSGKLQRRELARRFEAGEWGAVAQAPAFYRRTWRRRDAPVHGVPPGPIVVLGDAVFAEGLSAHFPDRGGGAPSAYVYASLGEVDVAGFLALVHDISSRPARLRLVARGPCGILAGLVETLRRESPGLDVRFVDVGDCTPGEAVARVAIELASGKGDRESRWRDGERWVPGLERVEPGSGPIPFRNGGTWLVTGGLGGVGEVLARHLLGEFAARLLLVGRSPLEGAVSRRFEALASLARRERGEVRYAAVDIADVGALAAIVATAEAGWGVPLEGVLHLAGTLDDRALVDENATHFEAALHAKREGTRALCALLRNRDAWLLAFSSVASMSGAPGAGAYAAANRQLEVLLDAWREDHPRTHVTTWVAWDEVGLARGRYVGAALSPSLAIAAWMRALADGRDLVVGPDPSAPEVRRLLGECVLAVPIPVRVKASPPLVRDAPGDGPTARRLERIWREVLGQAVAGRAVLGATFFELGGDSLLLVRMRALVEREFDREVPLAELFRHPTVPGLAGWLAGGAEEPQGAAPPVSTDAIAVIGMAARLPGAADVDEYWANLCAGVSSIRFADDATLAAAGVPEAERRDPHYVPARGVLADVAGFDAAFFGMPPREAAETDPQHRLFLECAWEALERAGYDPARLSGAIGVFGGAGLDGYLVHHLGPARAARGTRDGLSVTLGNDSDHLATRVAHRLDLRGPALTVQTACSTSLVAVHLACQELRAGTCEIALAGGVNIGFPVGAGYLHQPGHILSPDGHCRAFDADGAGTVGGDGVGIVVLRRLADALAAGDHIHAVILGTAVNNDGARKMGYTAPSVAGQAQVVAAAVARAGVAAETIGYIEAHGTGTALGDPIEVAALARALGPDRPAGSPRWIGSVKPNIGHLNAAAGVAGLIKACLAVERGQIPPSLHFARVNPEIDLAAGGFAVNARLRDWTGPRRAGVSAFGFGGTNAHVVIESPPPPPPLPLPSTPRSVMLPVSARSPAALEAAVERLGAYLAAHPDLPLSDVAFTLQAGRRSFPHRSAFVATHPGRALQVLARRPVATGVACAVEVAFVFPGQGAQFPGMGRSAMEDEPVFRVEIARGCDILGATGARISALMDGDSTEAGRTDVAQPALFLVEYAYARLLQAYGVEPSALLGHSVGEYVAACLAGVMTFEDALRVVAERGRIVHALARGAMVAVECGGEAVSAFFGGDLVVAVENAPDATVVAGSVEEVEALLPRLVAAGIAHRRLLAAHAFHSPAMEPATAPLRALAGSIALSPPRIPMVSSATGTWLTDREATDPAYWARQLVEPVRFSAALGTLLADPGRVFVEVGPGRTVAAAMRRHAEAAGRMTTSVAPDGAGADAFATSLARLWVAGAAIDPTSARRGLDRRVPLPTYPFERLRHWVERSETTDVEPPLDDLWETIRGTLAVETIDDPRLALDGLCSAWILRLLRTAGVDFEGDHDRHGLGAALGVLPKFDRLFDAFLAILAEDGLLRGEGDRFTFASRAANFTDPSNVAATIRAHHPRFAGIADLLDHCGPRLADALSGRVEAIGVLYPGGSPRLVEECDRRTARYRDDRTAIHLACTAVRRLVARSPGPVRILEVGGGQGLLTWPLLEAVQTHPTPVRYHFTDLGSTFVADARREGRRRGWADRMQFDVLDAGRPEAFPPAGYDLVVAYNVLHAVPDLPRALRGLRRLLVPGGTLAVVEVLRTERWDTLTWGLAEGWWSYADEVRTNSPLLPMGAWQELLRGVGFEDVEGHPRSARVVPDHALFLATSPQHHAARLPSAPSARAASTAPPAPGPSVSPRPLASPSEPPKTALEVHVARIVADLLGVDSVGLHDDFFALGADSLLLLRVVDQLARELGQEVPAEATYRGATVARIVAALGGQRPIDTTALVPIQPGGSRPALYFVHPATGVVFPYFELARALGPEQPFYGLQALGLDGARPVDTRIEDMARHYIAAIRTVQPRGPYHIGGFSFGCLVAYEMAVQLAEAGDAVGLVALLDEPAPIDGYRPSPWVMAGMLARGAFGALPPFVAEYLALRDGAPRGGDSGPLRRFFARTTLAGFFPPEGRALALAQPSLVRLFDLFLLHGRLTLEFEGRAYPHKVTLLKATDLPGRAGRDPTQGWRMLAAGGVDVFRVPGEHLTLLRRPHVQAVADRLTRCLAAANRAGD